MVYLQKKVFLLSSKRIDAMWPCKPISLIYLVKISGQAMPFCPSNVKENELEYRKENEFFKYIKAFT